MSAQAIQDVIGWDTTNWSQALPFWDTHMPRSGSEQMTALELGGCFFNGGLSLWLALQGIKTVCSGFHPNPRKFAAATEATRVIHQKHGIADLIDYEQMDATRIPYKSQFDIICYKSMLGGIVRDRGMDVATAIVDGVREALKPGGLLLFVENKSSSAMHQMLRNRYGAGKEKWRFFTTNEFVELHRAFSSFEYETYGFLGCLGRSERQRSALGVADQSVFSRIVPKRWNYILAGVATKGDASTTPQSSDSNRHLLTSDVPHPYQAVSNPEVSESGQDWSEA